MKKFLALALALSMGVSMVGCAPTTPTTSTPSTSKPSISTPDTSVPEVDPEPEIWMPFDDNGIKRTERDATGENGVVTSSNVYATMAGLEILEQGGSAVDAAIAVCYALGVAEPFTSGIGGGGFMMIHTADGKDSFIDYREVAPSNQTAQTWLGADGKVVDSSNKLGGMAVGVPGAVAGMEYALENFGSGNLTREQIMQPAIDLANEGYIVSTTMAGSISDNYEHMIGRFTDLGAYYLDENDLPFETGAVITNPDLANTLTLIAEGGQDAFYTGEIAEAVVAAVAKNDGVMVMEDLANYEPHARIPVTSTYRDYQIISAPPASSGGTHLIESLNIMENYDVAGMDVNSAEYIHLVSEALKISFADRAAYMADTDFAPDVPLEGLTSKEYAAARAAEITDVAQEWNAGDPFAYGHDSTTSFSIADKEGNVVTVTQTIECFWGSKVAVPGYGFILNDEMHDFATNPESVNKVEGGKRPLSSMTPTVILNADGTPFMTLGSPGGLRIWPTLVQVVSHVIDHDMDIQDAIDSARIYNNGTDSGINLESGGLNGVTAETIAELEAMGHVVTDKGEWQLFFGGVQGIVYEEDGTIRGGADPRRDGKALGF